MKAKKPAEQQRSIHLKFDRRGNLMVDSNLSLDLWDSGVREAVRSGAALASGVPLEVVCNRQKRSTAEAIVKLLKHLGHEVIVEVET